MSFDFGSILDQVIPEVTKGLVTQEQADADRICTKWGMTTTLSGRFPRMTNVTTMGRAENVGLAPGALAKEHGGGLAEVLYNCLAYVGYDFISDPARNDLAAFGEDLIADRVRQARIDANTGVDIALATLLADVVANNEFNVLAAPGGDGNGAWTDKVNSTPLNDMVKAKHEFAPGADAIYYGPRVKRTLIDHPDFIAEDSHFDAGQRDLNSLNAFLAGKLNIPLANIFYVEKFYNSANEGQPPVITYIGDEVFWMGHRSDLLMIDPSGPINNLSETNRNIKRRGFEISHARYVDFVRPTRELGVTFTNIIA
ncbi:MAG: hypothetical protein HRU13_02210 [Phycisphaerales bacterium]|nr:hypothetical protein [Phycisphaerales bacterium]